MERVTAWESFEPELDKHDFARRASQHITFPDDLFVVRDEDGDVVAIYWRGVKFEPERPPAAG